MVPETPPCEIVLDWDSDPIISASASGQLITTQLVSGAKGAHVAEWNLRIVQRKKKVRSELSFYVPHCWFFILLFCRPWMAFVSLRRVSGLTVFLAFLDFRIAHPTIVVKPRQIISP